MKITKISIAKRYEKKDPKGAITESVHKRLAEVDYS